MTPTMRCNNPNHFDTDGSPHEHEIGPSCMATPTPLTPEEALEGAAQIDEHLRTLFPAGRAAAEPTIDCETLCNYYEIPAHRRQPYREFYRAGFQAGGAAAEPTKEKP